MAGSARQGRSSASLVLLPVVLLGEPARPLLQSSRLVFSQCPPAQPIAVASVC